MADINKDGYLEYVFASFGGTQNYVYAVNRNGQVLWQKALGESGTMSSPAIGDINGDGEVEIVIGSEDGKVHALTHLGGDFWNPAPNVGAPVRSSPALADIDSDGILEVVFAAQNRNVYAYDGDKTERWWCQTGGNHSAGSPAIGDIDGDGQLEILIGASDGYLYVLSDSAPHFEYVIEADSKTTNWEDPFWDASGGLSKVEAAALWDVDGDLLPEIAFGAFDQKVRLVKYKVPSQGQIKGGEELWHFDMGQDVFSSVALADCDGNGKLDMAIGARSCAVTRLAADHSITKQGSQWPVFRHDARRTGCRPIRRRFIRGDANNDKRFDIADMIFIQRYLAGSGSMPSCQDAADADDDGCILPADFWYIYYRLFCGGPPPPPPCPVCGLGPTEGALTCHSAAACP